MSDSDCTRQCSRCGQVKGLEGFHRNRRNPLGRDTRCKQCVNPQIKQYQERNREKERARYRAYHAANREARNAQSRACYQDQQEARRAYAKAYREANKDEVRLCVQKWRDENPDKLRVLNRNYRARLRGAAGTHTTKDIETKYAEQKGRCYWCSTPLRGVYHLDHIIPLSKGGGNGPGNICCACPPCNLSKKAKMPSEFCGRLF